jgi:quinol monooxygenase YgiN
MIVIAGHVNIRPELREEAVRAASAMARATRAEAGCRTYRFSADLDDPNLFLIFEEWESDEALAGHFRSEHMRVFREQIPTMVARPSTIVRYEIASQAPM